MTTYLKDNFEMDFGLFTSKISMINSKVSEMIEKFSKGMEAIEEENKDKIEIIEDLGTVAFPADLMQSLVDLSENLKNQVFHNSVSISIYSFLEFSLIEYCRLIENYIEAKKSFKDYRNFGIEKAKDYLNDNFDIEFGNYKEWSELMKFQKVRNLIVHNDANVIKDYDKSIEEQPDYPILAGMTDSINITSSGTFFITNFEYLNTTLSRVIELINNIINATKDEVKKKEVGKD